MNWLAETQENITYTWLSYVEPISYCGVRDRILGAEIEKKRDSLKALL